jgi:hypothetical protein
LALQGWLKVRKPDFACQQKLSCWVGEDLSVLVLYLDAGSRARAAKYFFFARPKKKYSKRKDARVSHPIGCPALLARSGARPTRRLTRRPLGLGHLGLEQGTRFNPLRTAMLGATHGSRKPKTDIGADVGCNKRSALHRLIVVIGAMPFGYCTLHDPSVLSVLSVALLTYTFHGFRGFRGSCGFAYGMRRRFRP